MEKARYIARRLLTCLASISMLGLGGCTKEQPAPLPPGYNSLTCTPQSPQQGTPIYQQQAPVQAQRIESRSDEDEEGIDEDPDATEDGTTGLRLQYDLGLNESQEDETSSDHETTPAKSKANFQGSKNTITYDNYVKNLIAENCLRCHKVAVKKQMSLKSWADVAKVKDRVAKSIIEKTMPPEGEGKLSESKIEKIKRWQKAKFPENSGDDDTEDNQDNDEDAKATTAPTPVFLPPVQQTQPGCPPAQPYGTGVGGPMGQSGTYPVVTTQPQTPPADKKSPKDEEDEQ